MRKKLNEIEQRDIDRFWSKVNIKGNEECWLWTGARDKDGYGKFAFHSGSIPANRAALYFEKGGEYEGMLCMHSCDNPPCCNPSHLKWGTAYENTMDMVNKGRHSMHIVNIHEKYPESVMRGETHVFAKLSDLEVAEIRQIWNNREMTYQAIAEKYNISHAHVTDLINNKKRISAEFNNINKGNDFRYKLKNDEVFEVIKLYKTGLYSQKEIAEKFNLNPCTVSRLVNSKRRKAILQNTINQ